ncbi:MAG TPA: hypothetical protein VGK20_02525 [Candidatus Binatia bacterium]|jgi:hypothetical protein
MTRQVRVPSIARTTAATSVALAALCALIGIGDAASVLFGGAVSIANLHLIRIVVSRLMTADATGPRLSQVVTIKFLILLALLAVAFGRLPIDAASFLAGTATLVVAVVLEALLLGEPSREGGDEAGEANIRG